MVPGMGELDDMIASLRALGAKDLGARIAKRSEEPLQAAIVGTLEAGTAPDGTPWAGRKKDGARPYANAASRVSTKSSGDVLRMTLKGPEVFGHFGARGMPVRQMLPDAGAAIPEVVSKAIEEGAAAVLAEELGK